MAWQKLASDTLTGTGDNMVMDLTVTGTFLQMVSHQIQSGNIWGVLELNNDTGSNYAGRYSVDGAGDATGGSVAYGWLDLTNGALDVFVVSNIINISAEEKLIMSWSCHQATAGAGTAPSRTEVVVKWANTSAQITEIDLKNLNAGDFATDSDTSVLGTD